MGSCLEEVRSKLEELSRGGQLSASQALARANEIVSLAGAEAVALERQGQFQDAATLYGLIAQAFEIAARQVAEQDRWRVASLGEYWSLKAKTARATPTFEAQSATPPAVESLRDPIGERPTLKMQQGAAPITGEHKPSSSSDVQRAIDPKKISDVQRAGWTAAQPSPVPGEPGAPSGAGRADVAKPGKGQSKRPPSSPSRPVIKIDRKPEPPRKNQD